ncbi:dGTP triphosphohydrolase [Lentzea sp. NPDC003310]|uniref:deoxyguanosinetriphosphate triphosphohydrolase family protein n=1 Tax=Lentzea sp. NPDC003310 TaxID=3154447 RepID=UPI0033ACFA1A
MTKDRELVRLTSGDPRRDARLVELQVPRGPDDIRSEARRDRDRILYSVAWRRLGGVTQVVTPFEDMALMHNRLTHSEKVAQVARSIAERLLHEKDARSLIVRLGGIDADVVEAAALAHDLGHPPFGHIGEITLDKAARRTLKLPDGFEGNAQTFRTVLRGETRSSDYPGLNLTCATLVAIAKYPWQRDPTLKDDHRDKLKSDAEYRRRWRKFSVYRSEAEAFRRARGFLKGIEGFLPDTQSLEASIMDVADDITYAIHDLEDFYLAGILDVRAVLDELRVGDSDGLLKRLQERLLIDYPDYFSADLFAKAVEVVKKELKDSFSAKNNGGLQTVGRARSAGSKLIGKYINAVEIREGVFWEHGPYIALRADAWHEVQLLKKITKNFVVKRPDIALLQRGQQQLLRELVRSLLRWKNSKADAKRLPRRLRDEIDMCGPGDNPNRCILDYICTLTDGQCYALYYKLTGSRPAASAMDFFL